MQSLYEEIANELCVKEAEDWREIPRICGLYFPLSLQHKAWQMDLWAKYGCLRAKPQKE